MSTSFAREFLRALALLAIGCSRQEPSDGERTAKQTEELWQGAKLVARADEATMAELRTHLRAIEDRERVESDAEWRDGSYAGLRLTGEGTRSGRPIEVAACGTPKLYSQLTTKEAERIIDFYWRLLGGALQWTGGSVCMGLPPIDIKPQVRGWWTPR
jgi:hypothetical protein